PNAADADVIHALHRESEARAGSLQLRQIALSSGPETEIASNPHLAHAQRVYQELLNETIGRPARELVREGDDQERVDVHRAQDLLLLRQRQDLLRHPVGGDDRERMGIKCDDRRRTLRLPGALYHSSDDRLVTDVQAVEL